MARGGRAAEEPVSFFSFQDVMMCTIGITIVITMVLMLQLTVSVVKTAQIESTASSVQRDGLAQEAAGLRARLEAAAARAPAQAGQAASDLRVQVNEQNQAAERLGDRYRKAMQQLRATSARRAVDAATAEAADLLQRRDELEERLRADSLRRRVTYLVAEDTHVPTIVEVSGSRVVAGTTFEKDAQLSIAFSDADAVAATLASWMRGLPDADRRSVLFVVKPSGVAAWRALRERFPLQPGMADVPTGLDLIPEEAFTSERFRPVEPSP
jgi:hypothetical protein